MSNVIQMREHDLGKVADRHASVFFPHILVVIQCLMTSNILATQ